MRCLVIAASLSGALCGQMQTPPMPLLQAKPLFAIVQIPGPGFGAGSHYKFADLDRDGLVDVLASDATALIFWAGRGNGRFAPYVAYPAPTGGAWRDVADIDGDGDLDAVLAPIYGPPYGQPSRMMLNDGRAVFTDASAIAFPAGPPSGPFYVVRFADIDGDGDPDLVFGPLPLRAFFNDGRGHFVEDTAAMPILTQNTVDMVFADFDGDGDLDFVTANGGYLGVEPNYIFWNDGRGHFPTYAALPALLFGAIRVAAADLDGDGDVDLLFCGLRSQSVLLRNDGAGRFTDISSRLSQYPVPNLGPYAVALGDLDQDGDIDIVRGAGPTLLLDINRGDGTFEPKNPEHFFGIETLHYLQQDGLSLVDTDQDGDLDLWIGQGGLTEIYWGAVTHLHSPTYAPLGSMTALHVFGFEGIAVLATGATRLATPLSTPYGFFWLDPAALVVDPAPVVVDRNGIGVRPLQVPNSGALRNRTLQFQALHFAPSRPWLRLTNVAGLTLY